jgi:hypothetical protein
MKVIENTKDLETWLDENYWFEDGYVAEITTHKNEHKMIDLVEIRLGYQIEGTLEGGTPITLKEYIIKAKNIKLWTFSDKTMYDIDNCITELDIINDCDGIGIELDVPELVRLICNSIIVEGPFLKKSIRKPWVSDRHISFYIKDGQVPKPSEWIQWLSEIGLNASWRYGGSEAKSDYDVPFPDYAGWFLQETYKIPTTQFGVFFCNVGFYEGKLSLSLEKYDKNIDGLWSAVTTVLALKPQVEILSGNCRFNGSQWLEYLNSKIVPENMYGW